MTDLTSIKTKSNNVKFSLIGRDNVKFSLMGQDNVKFSLMGLAPLREQTPKGLPPKIWLH
jgi:hypothetical protein